MRSARLLVFLAAAATMATCADGVEPELESVGSAAVPCGTDFELVSPNPRYNSWFGVEVTGWGNRFAVSAPTTGVGEVHVFDSSGAPVMTLVDPDSGNNFQFGAATASYGPNLAVLSRNADHDGDTINDGAVFVLDPAGSILVVATGGAEWLGEDLATDGSSLFLGNGWSDVGAIETAGRVREFDGGGAPVRVFQDPQPLAWHKFGESVALGVGLVFVGSPHTWTGQSHGQGEVHVFSATTGAHVRSFASPQPAQDDAFGTDLAVRGEEVIVTAPGINRAYRFHGPSGVLLATYVPPLTIQDGAVAWIGDLVFIGSPISTVQPGSFDYAGHVLVFDEDGGFLYKFNAAAPVEYERFGSALAPGIPGTIIVGAPNRTGGPGPDVANFGAAYVMALNRPPVASSATKSTRKDEPAIITPTVTDPTADSLTLAITFGPLHGSTSIVGGAIHYTPEAGYVGPDVINFTANDGCNDSNTGDVIIDVKANNPPTSGTLVVSGSEDSAIPVPLAAVDPNGDPVTYTVLTTPENGTLSGTAPNLTFTPSANYAGGASFTYAASDGVITGNTATVTITVNGVNDAPAGVAEAYATDEDVLLVVPGAGVLSNDTDIDSVSLTAGSLTQPAHGSVVLQASGSFVYAPAANYSGADSFTYRASDGSLSSAITTVSVTVAAVDDAPVAVADSFTVQEDSPLELALLANDGDVDSQIAASIVTAPAHGETQLSGAGILYVPDANYSGPDSLTYLVSDAVSSSPPVTVTISVQGVPDAPTVPAQLSPQDGASVDEGDLLEWQASFDVEGDALQYEVELLRGGVVLESLPSSSTSVALPKLDTGEWEWRVRSIDASGEASAYSPAREIRVGGGTSSGCSVAPVRTAPSLAAWTLLGVVALVWRSRR